MRDSGLGELLRRHRERLGLSQEELAERASGRLSVSTIGNIERGRSRPYRYTLEALCAALGLMGAEREELLAARASAAPAPLGTGAAAGVAAPAAAPGPGRAQPVSLPRPATPLVGRTREVAAVRALLERDVRLVTLTGVGGTGKTRLALESAAGLEQVFPDGVVFTPLAQIIDPGLVPAAVARALGLPEVPGLSPHAQLVHALHAKCLLLLLDNLEHLLPAAAWVAELLEAVPGLTILVTSRVNLRVYGEHEFRVPPLRLPSSTEQDVAELLRSEAVQLFVQRARAVKPELATTPAALAAIAAICRALDGLPLAIELAAARSKLFSPQAMLPRLRDRLSLLTAGPRNLAERQQTLRNTLDWSYHLLPPAEQDLFARLGVFTGTFGLAAASVVCELRDDALDRLAGLADSGLLEYVEAEEPSFRMLETVREYALARLEAAGAESVCRRHAGYYLDLVERTEPHLTGPHQTTWAALLEQEHDNLRAALAWLRENEPSSALRMAVGLDPYWTRSGHLREARGWLETVLERVTEPERLRGRALVVLGSVLTEMGEPERADALLREALSIDEALEDPRGLLAVRFAQANAAHHRGDYATARLLGEEALAGYRELDDRLGTATTLQYLGSFAMYEPDLERASLLLDESSGLYDAVGDLQGQAMCTMLRGVIALFQGEAERAWALLSDGLRLSWELGDVWTVGRSLAALALVAAARGEAARAVQLWAAAEALLERMGVPLAAAGIPSVAAQRLAGLRERMGEARWAEAERAGQGLTAEEAVELALEVKPG